MERMGIAPGTEIGGYRVVEPLGHGGMGAVSRAVDGDGSPVALKLLPPHLGADPDARERLRREVSHLQKVRHPGVARVLDAEIESAEAFVVTELVDGQDLSARVKSRGPLSAVELADLAERLHDALVVVHQAGVLHRDLTPGNVLVTDRGPVLIDFGIAQAADDARVTSTGLVVGTPGYLSPELLEGAEPSTAGDWWGWSAVLAFAATGRPPFGVRPLAAVLARARTGDADLDGLAGRTTAVLRSALQVDPWRRATPEEVVAQLRAAANGDTEPDGGQTALLTGAPTAATALLASDGRTRALPVDVPGPSPVTGPSAGPDGGHPEDDQDAEADDGWDDDGYGDGYDGSADPDDPDRDDGEQPTLGPAPAEPGRRVGTVLAAGALLAALGTTRPGVSLVAAAVLAVLLRTVGVAALAVRSRRSRRGPGGADVARALAASPWYLARAFVGVLPAVLVGASVVVIVGSVTWWLVASGRWVVAAPPAGQPAGELYGNATWVVPVLVGAVALVGLLMIWFGPMSRTTRLGGRWVARALAPGWAGATTAVVLLLGAAALVLVLLHGEPTVWWPLPGAPDLH